MFTEKRSMRFEYGLKRISFKHICQQMSTHSETSASLDMTRTRPKDCCLGGGRVVLCEKKAKFILSMLHHPHWLLRGKIPLPVL